MNFLKGRHQLYQQTYAQVGGRTLRRRGALVKFVIFKYSSTSKWRENLHFTFKRKQRKNSILSNSMFYSCWIYARKFKFIRILTFKASVLGAKVQI